MASIKGLTIEIDGSTTKLTKALQEPKKATQELKSELSNVNSMLKYDTSNVELLEKKQRLVKSAIEATEQELQILKEAQKQYKDSGADIDGAEYVELEKKIAIVEGALKNLKDQQSNFSGELQALGEKVRDFGDKCGKVADKIAPFSAAAGAFGGYAVKTASDFDAGMSEVAAISGATGDDLDKLRDKASEMGQKTQYSAAEAAEAFKFMAMAGWDTDKMLGGIEGTMSLAAASGENLGTVSDIVTDAMTAFGLSADKAGHFADILATASSASNTNVGLMGETFKYVAPVAGALSMSAEDAAVAIGLMANSGIKGSQAGTSLKNALSNLAAPSEKMEMAMSRYGISLTDTEGNTKSLMQIMKELRTNMSTNSDVVKKARLEQEEAKWIAEGYGDSLKGLTDAEKESVLINHIGMDMWSQLSTKEQEALTATYGLSEKFKDGTIAAQELDQIFNDLAEEGLTGLSEAEQAAAASTIFGKEAMSGMLAIINASDEDFQSLTDSIYGCEGSAQQMADVKMDNLQGDIALLKSAFDEFAKSIGDSLMPKIRDIVQKGTEFINWLNGLPSGAKTAVAGFTAITAGAYPTLKGVEKLCGAFDNTIKYFGSTETIGGRVVASFKSIGGEAGGGLMTNLKNLATNGIGKVSSGWSNLAGAFGTTGGVLAGVVAAIAILIGAFVDLWRNNEEFREKITAIWDGIKQMFSDFFDGLSERLGGIQINFETVTEAIKLIWDGFCELLAPVFEGAFQQISNTIELCLGVITGVLDILIGLFTGDWEQLWQGVQEVFGSCWDYLCSYFDNIVQTMIGIADVICGWFGTDWETVWQGVSDFWSGIWNGISSFFGGIWDGIKNTTKAASDWFIDTFTPIWQGICDAFHAIWDPICDIFSGIWDTLKGIFDGDSNLIKQGLDKTWNGIKDLTKNVWNGIKDFFKFCWDGIKKIPKNVCNFFTDFIPQTWNSIKDKTKEIWGNIKSFFGDTWNNLKDKAKQGWTNIKDGVSDAWDNVKTKTKDTWNNIKTTTGQKWDEIKTAVSDRTEKIKTGISEFGKIVGEKLSNKWTEIKNDASAKWENIKQTIKDKMEQAKTNADNIGRGIATALGYDWDEVKRTASDKWNAIKNAIKEPFDNAKQHISDGIDRIKQMFNFQIQWPHIPLPHFTISGSANPLDWLEGFNLPSFRIDWYAKAMRKGMLLNNPTIFGSQGGQLLGAGEAGPEAVIGAQALDQLVYRSTERAMQSYEPIDYDRLATAVVSALGSQPLTAVVDARSGARAMAPYMDREFQTRTKRR